MPGARRLGGLAGPAVPDTGTFACKKTRYQKDTGNGFVVDITAWTNGQAGLEKRP